MTLPIDPKLQDDYDRWLKRLGEDLFAGHTTVGVFDVLRAHYLIVDYFVKEGYGVGGIGPRDATLLCSTVGRQIPSFGGLSKWNDDLDKCATLFWGLIKNHVFHDGNKRTALLTLLLHLWRLNRTLEENVKQKDLELLALRIAKNTLDEYKDFEQFSKKADAEILFISRFLRKATRRLDKKDYLITYHDLHTILQRFDFQLANPSKNHIDVIKVEQNRRLTLRGIVNETLTRRVGVIAFPGWTRQVSKPEIRKVRELTNLVAERGYDSDVFFRGASPLGALIDQYRGPLERLANK